MIKIVAVTLSLCVLSCSKSSSPDRKEGDHTGAGTLDGTVKSSSHPDVKVGAACEGSIVMRGTKTPAKLAVSCGGVAVYEGEGMIANDTSDPNDPDDDILSYRDEKTSADDKTPACHMTAQEGKADGESGLLTIFDDASGDRPAYQIIISI